MTDTQQAPWLTIGLPAYNVEPYLEECIDSILDQSDEGVEIILCEDCSTDGTLALARQIAERNAGRITIIVNEHNRGLSATRNRLLDHAQGEYVWFIDTDDFLRPGAIAAVRDAIERFQPDLLGGAYRKRRMHVSAFKGPHGQLITERDRIVAGICRSRKLYAWLRIARRSVWQAAPRFPEGKIFEDAAVIPHLGLHARSYVHVSKALIQYRIRSDSILGGVTRTPDRFRIEPHLDMARALENFGETLEQFTDEPMDRTRFAVSHFIAMEFAKIVKRIGRAGPEGCGVDDTAPVIGQFYEIMNAGSPYKFDELVKMYPGRGQMIAWFLLRRALAQVPRQS